MLEFFFSGGETRVINLKVLLVFSAQKCWLAYQEGLKPASASSLRVAANTVAMAPHTRCCHPHPPPPTPPPFLSSITIKDVLIVSAFAFSHKRLKVEFFSPRRNPEINITPPLLRIQLMEVFVVVVVVVNPCMNIYDHMLK